MSKYYSNILTILNKKGISQYKFAQMLEVPRSTLHNWLTGKFEPSMEMIKKTADLLDISIDKDIFKR